MWVAIISIGLLFAAGFVKVCSLAVSTFLGIDDK